MVPLTSPLIHVAGLETTHVACPAMPEPSLDAQVAWGRPFLFLHMSISYPKTPCTLAHFASELGAVIFHSEKRNKKFRIFVSFVFTPTIFFFFVLLFHVSAALCSFHTLQPDGSGTKNKGH